MEWYKLTASRKRTIIEEVAARQGLPTQAVEKDWWVTQCLRAIFQSSVASHIIFKGGTSLSKGWGLIDRFSEDIDLSIDRELLGFSGELSKSQITKLRKRSCEFVSKDLATIVQDGLSAFGAKDFEMHIPPSPNSDTDPQTIYVTYPSLVPMLDYLPARVKIEVGARALMEPIESRPIRSMIGLSYGDAAFADDTFPVASVLPKRTFLEKVFLLHELLASTPERVGARLTRHLYDLERIMDTEHGEAAISDVELFQQIANFRRQYNAIKNVDYDMHQHEHIAIVPSLQFRSAWEADYEGLASNMIFGDALTFSQLLDRMDVLQARFNGVPKAN